MCLKESSKRVDLRPLIQVLNPVDTALPTATYATATALRIKAAIHTHLSYVN